MRTKPKRTNRATILRRWKAGYYVWSIAKEFGISEYRVAQVLAESGVTYFAIEQRIANRQREVA